MEVTDFINVPVYTNRGIYVGEVRNVMLDIERRSVAKLILTDTNKNMVENGANVAVPYRWVSAVGDIMILNYFPEQVVMSSEPPEEEEEL
jgi:sporulation protein YlmC with PRC-barrel domain